MRSVKVSKPPSPEVQVGNTSGVGISSLPKDHKMIIDEMFWNEMFGESSEESFKGFDEVEVGLNKTMEEKNTNKKQGNKKDLTRRTWNKEVNKLDMKCYLMSGPSKRGYKRRMYGIWQDIGIFEIIEQHLADQVRVIKSNEWLSKMKIEEIKRNIEMENNSDVDINQSVRDTDGDRGIEMNVAAEVIE